MSGICGPTSEVIHTEPVGIRWCFVCRKRVEFTDRFRVPVEPSYWEPFWTRTCAAGHVDGDVGFGRWREWQ